MRNNLMTLFFISFTILCNSNNISFANNKNEPFKIAGIFDNQDFIKAEKYYEQKDYKTSIDYYKKAIEADKNKSDFFSGLAKAYYQIEQYEDASYYSKRAIEIDKRNDSAYNTLACVYMYSNSKNIDLAIFNYKKALELDPKHSMYNFNLALAYSIGYSGSDISKNNLEEAVKYYEKAINLNQKNVNYYIFLISTLYDLKNIDEALKYTKKALEKFPNNDSLLELLENIADYYNTEGEKLLDYNKSIDYYKKAIEIIPNNSIYYSNLSQVYYFKFIINGDSSIKDNIVDYANKALEIDSDNEEAYYVLAEYNNYYLNNFKKSEAYYNNAIAINPSDYLFFTGLAFLYKQNNYYDKSIKNYEKALSLNENLSSTYLLSMVEIYSSKNDYENSIRIYKKLYDTSTNYKKDLIISYYKFAEQEFNKKNYFKALDAYNQILKLDPKYAKAYFNIGVIYNTQKNNKKAKEFYKKACNNGYKNACQYAK